MNLRHLQVCFLVYLLTMADASIASVPEIDGVFGFEEATEPLSIAVWVPLTEGESVEGLSWYNNDASAVFPAIKAMAGVVDCPDDLANAVLVGQNVMGQSSSWSDFEFDQPIASTSEGIYFLFEIPLGGALIAEGDGGGHGVGYQVGDGLIRCWISTGTGTWDALAPEFQMAVVPTIAANKSGDVLVIERGHSANNSEANDLDTAEESLTSRMVVAPNPFNPTTEIKYALEKGGHVTLDLFDVRGRVVRRLVNANRSTGVHSAVWNGRDDTGRTLPSGTYFARMRSGSVRIVKRLTLIK